MEDLFKPLGILENIIENNVLNKQKQLTLHQFFKNDKIQTIESVKYNLFVNSDLFCPYEKSGKILSKGLLVILLNCVYFKKI
ncbi:hypothetical protein QTP88_005452 [Uroleucon formosanum]